MTVPQHGTRPVQQPLPCRQSFLVHVLQPRGGSRAHRRWTPLFSLESPVHFSDHESLIFLLSFPFAPLVCCCFCLCFRFLFVFKTNYRVPFGWWLLSSSIGVVHNVVDESKAKSIEIQRLSRKKTWVAGVIVLRAMEVLVLICDKKIREILFKKKTPDEMIIKKRIDS